MHATPSCIPTTPVSRLSDFSQVVDPGQVEQFSQLPDDWVIHAVPLHWVDRHGAQLALTDDGKRVLATLLNSNPAGDAKARGTAGVADHLFDRGPRDPRPKVAVRAYQDPIKADAILREHRRRCGGRGESREIGV